MGKSEEGVEWYRIESMFMSYPAFIRTTSVPTDHPLNIVYNIPGGPAECEDVTEDAHWFVSPNKSIMVSRHKFKVRGRNMHWQGLQDMQKSGEDIYLFI